MENEILTDEPLVQNEGQDDKPYLTYKAPTVAVRFALGRSSGIHQKTSPTPKNLREAKSAALRYCKTVK